MQKAAAHHNCPHKTFMQPVTSFDLLPPVLAKHPITRIFVNEVNEGRIERKFKGTIVPKCDRILKGEHIHGSLYASHRSIYTRILKHHVKDVAEKAKAQMSKLDELAEKVRANDPVLRNLAGKLIAKYVKDKKTLIEGLDPDYTKGEKLAAINASKQKLRRLISAIENSTSISDQILGDSTNFALAEITLVITTKNIKSGYPAKRMSVTIPLKVDDAILYNFKNVEDFKEFFSTTMNASKEILAKDNLEFDGEARDFDVDNCNKQYYPQKAYHSEKFLYYYLMHGGLESFVKQLPDFGISPQNIHSFNGMILHLHSTREVCGTCEAVTIGVKDKLLQKFNKLLTAKKYTGVESNAELAVDVTADVKCDRNLSTLQKKNFVPIRLRNISSLPKAKQEKYKSAVSRTHLHSFFSSGGESDASAAVGQRKIHERSISAVQKADEKRWEKLETDAATIIKRAFRQYRASPQYAVKQEVKLEFQAALDEILR